MANSNTIPDISNFDLNINNYNSEEIYEIFGIGPNFKPEHIKVKANKLRQNILKDAKIKKQDKKKTIEFINTAENKIHELMDKSLKHMDTIMKADIYNLNHNLVKSKLMGDGNYPVIDSQPTAYNVSFPQLTLPGVMNPVKRATITTIVNIDTRFRNNYYNTLSSNFIYDLPIRFKNVISMSLINFSYPSTFYNINTQNNSNFFWVSASPIDSNEVTEKLIILMPSGNYSPGDLIKYFNNYVTTNTDFLSTKYLKNLVFNLNIGGLSNSGSGQTIVGISSTYTGELFNFNLDFQSDEKGNPDYGTPIQLKLGWLVGFREGYYINNNTYVSEGIADTSIPHYMYLVVNDFNNSVYDTIVSPLNSSILSKNILARISLDLSTPSTNQSIPGAAIISTTRQYFGPINIYKFELQLIDEYGRIINFNNMDYSLCLSLDLIYDL